MSNTYRVQMLAFGDPGEVREVQIPPGPADNRDIEGILDLVFYWGQNDFQPQEHPSVSAGDVVEVGSDKYLIKNVGFRKLADEEYQEYLALPRRERSFHTLVNN